MNKRKIKFKTKFFAFQDMLITKNIASKSRNYVQSLKSNAIKTNYHVNNLANSLHPNKQEVFVSDIVTHKCNAKTFILKPNVSKLAYFRAGQYLSVTININGVNISRPFSICSSPNEAIEKNFYAITVKYKADGYVSKYILNNIKIGDQLLVSAPKGNLYYDNLRDPKHILAITAGSGITPFISMAKAIIDKTEDFYLTIILRNKKYDSILFATELDKLQQLSENKIKIIHLLSQEKNESFHYEQFSLNLIKQYMTSNTAIWMCGPKKMYNTLLTEIAPLKLANKFIRIEYSNDIGLPSSYPEYQNTGHKNNYKIHIKQFDQTYSISGSANDTILVSLQKAKIETKSNCLSGICSWCRVKIIKGEVFVPTSFAHPRAADYINKIYYSCATFPISDIEIEVN